MWRYQCPICKKMVEKPEMGREDVKRIATKSIYCPHCNGRLYVQESGATVDLAGALVNFFKQVGVLDSFCPRISRMMVYSTLSSPQK